MTRDVLQAVIDHTTAAGDQFGPPDDAGWRFTRAWLLAVRVQHLDGDVADIDRAFADVLALPEAFPGRPKLAAYVVTTAMLRKELKGKERIRNAVVLTVIADADPSPSTNWPPASAAARALGLINAAQYGEEGFDLTAAVEEVKRLATIVEGDEPYATMVGSARAALQHLWGLEHPELGQPEMKLPPGVSGAGKDAIELLSRFQRAVQRQDRELVKELWPQVVALPRDERLSSSLREGLALSIRDLTPMLPLFLEGKVTLDNGLEMGEGVMPPLDEPPLDPPSDVPVERWAIQVATAATAHIALDTKESKDRAIELLSAVLRHVRAHDSRRIYYETVLGSVLIDRYGRERRRSDLTAGIELLESARSRAKTIANFYWSMIAVPLSNAYHATGRAELARQVAISGLRSYAWSALLETTPDHVLAAARSAASNALDVARMCLHDKDVDGAVTALELGRGLLLFSAFETRDLEKRLADAGEPALAREWAAALAGGQDAQPEDLRRRVMSAITGVPIRPDGDGERGESLTSALDPPELAEIRAALTSLGSDALVYLVPGDGGTGVAIVVPARDEAYQVFLPGLDTSRLSAFERYLDEAARDLRVAKKIVPGQAAGAKPLDDVCLWAWDAAMGPLLRRLKADSRPVRLVLVPVRELARVPWHAAHNLATGERAIERAVFSYTPSARVLCQTAWRSRLATNGTGLVVGDPDTAGAARDLVAARVEASAVADLHPEARYVGRLPDGSVAAEGPGSKADVEGWLGEPGSGGLLHLACHGVVHAGEAVTSYLLLAGGERFGAEELIADLTRSGSRDVALAVLAACSTARSSRSYDEAYSIGSALLAANVRSVVSAQWSVPDSPTSVLMFMFHHFLNEPGTTPADALRSAQLWALRDRRPPESMPASLRTLLETHAVDALGAWAGFVHSGH